MGLFRTAAIAGVVIALMPTERGQQSHMAEQVAAAAKWTVTYCDRNPQTCTQAAEAWAVFVKKAEFAAKLAYDVAQEHLTRNGGEPRETQNARDGRDQPAPGARPLPALERGTLSKDDLLPAWRGHARPGA